MTPEEAINNIDDVLSSDVNYDESLDYELTSYDIDWLEKAKKALEMQIPKFVLCPKGFQGIRDTRYYCPACKSLTRQHEAICHKCGQAVKYPKEVYNKAENKIVLDWSVNNATQQTDTE